LIEPSALLAVELERIRAGAADEESRSCLKRRHAMKCSHEDAMCSGITAKTVDLALDGPSRSTETKNQ
jgi:hypothetical protein